MARLSRDALLEQDGARAFAREDLAASLAVDVKLRPDSASDQADLELLKAHRP